jgi:hypothetical protein
VHADLWQHFRMHSDALHYWAEPGRFTTLDEPVECEGIDHVVDVVQGLLVYDLVAAPFYGVELPPEQMGAIHERDTARLLALARTVDDRPLTEARPPECRVGARCHAFTRVAVALMRANGVPARARCGFATYFNPGWLEDHWVVEYWDAAEARWRMADVQLDDTWRRMIGFTGDPTDITATQFVTAGHAWQAWRRGELDAGICGLSQIPEHGAHWIAGNLRLDLAALNKVEMLPWDVWGDGWRPGEEPSDEQLALYDEIAELTVYADARFADLRAGYDHDARLTMDGTVFNVLRSRLETV